MTSEEDLENSIYKYVAGGPAEVFWPGLVIIFYFSSSQPTEERRWLYYSKLAQNINIVFPSIANRIILMLAILE